MPPTGHALLSASSAHRWLVCTAAPRFEEQFPGGTSVYAEEGSLAHEICELLARRTFKDMDEHEFEVALDKAKSNGLYKPEMINTANAYCDYLKEKAQTFSTFPHMDFEVKVDLSDIIPEGFGTCDSIMIGGDTIHITDYKHGMGVQVSAVENPQMRLYAYGALKKYRMVYGNSIKKISMGICQPRITLDASEDCLTVDELMEWGEQVKAIADVAFNGPGEFVPGDHCKFCRGKSLCRARADQYSAVADFQSLVIPSKATPPSDPVQRKVIGLPPIMSNEEIAKALDMCRGLTDWYEDLKEYAKQAMLNGEIIPGYKVVAGKSNRVFSIPDEKVQSILRANGFSDDSIFNPQEQRSLSDLEKTIGKKRFADLLGGFVTKPIGKPALAEETDKRPVYSPAAKDFENVGK